jgi:Beta-catenin-interacting protein ICAT
VRQKLDILEALANLDEVLTAEEAQFREAHADSAAKHFAAAKSGKISQAALAKTIVK